MTRAEEAANKAYPTDENSAFNYALKLGFIEGYDQAEKDLALTWQDIRRIVKIADAELGRHTQDELAEMGEEKYYEKILEKYNQPR